MAVGKKVVVGTCIRRRGQRGCGSVLGVAVGIGPCGGELRSAAGFAVAGERLSGAEGDGAVGEDRRVGLTALRMRETRRLWTGDGPCCRRHRSR